MSDHPSQEIEQIITTRITDALAPAQVQLRDMTGTRDHWEAVIVSEQFAGLRLIKRQQRVYQALGELMQGAVHAFTMQTLTPDEATAKGISVTTSDADTSNVDPTDDERSGTGGANGSGGLISLG